MHGSRPDVKPIINIYRRLYNLIKVNSVVVSNLNPSIIISLSSESVELNKEVIHFVSIAAGILIVGMLVSDISTYFALNKFIWVKSE